MPAPIAAPAPRAGNWLGRPPLIPGRPPMSGRVEGNVEICPRPPPGRPPPDGSCDGPPPILGRPPPGPTPPEPMFGRAGSWLGRAGENDGVRFGIPPLGRAPTLGRAPPLGRAP